MRKFRFKVAPHLLLPVQRSTDNVYGGYVDGSNNGLLIVVPGTPHVYHLDALLLEHGKRILDSDHLPPSRVFRLWLGLWFRLRFWWGWVTSPFLRGGFIRASQCLARRLDRASLRLPDRIVFLYHLGNLLLDARLGCLLHLAGLHELFPRLLIAHVLFAQSIVIH